jgi:hypothetical protein
VTPRHRSSRRDCSQDEKSIYKPKRDRWHHEHVDRRGVGVIVNKGPPALHRPGFQAWLALEIKAARRSKGENFGLQGFARPEQPNHGVPDQLEEIAHHRDSRPIRRRSTAILGLRQVQRPYNRSARVRISCAVNVVGMGSLSSGLETKAGLRCARMC